MIEEKKSTFTFRTLPILIGALILCFTTTGAAAFLPRVAHAQVSIDGGVSVPVLDHLNLVQNSLTAGNTTALAQKELVSDGIFYMAAKLVIQNITDSVVRWINSGFHGSPAFITDPQAFFMDVGDQVAGNYIAGTDLDFLCSPFQLQIRAALNFNYSSKRRIVCRLTDAIKNVQDFAKFTGGDFSQGGWDGWFSMTQNPANNPYGAYASAQEELSLRITGAQGRELTIANWGKGFLSSQECLEPNSHIVTHGDGSQVSVVDPGCKKPGPITTPGSVIEDQLSNVLGSGVRQLELADEFNEVVGALMGQFVQQVLIGGLSKATSVKDNNSSNSYNNLINGTCSASTNVAHVGERVTWYASRYEPGVTNYTYSWQGDGPLAGLTGSSVTVQYATSSVYKGRVSIGGGSGLNVVNCSNSVTVTP